MESSSHDLQKILRDLSESPFRHERYNAAMKLGQLSENDEEIARALAAAVALDEDVDVRSAAMQALHSPVHQAFLKDRPKFVREAMKSAAENKDKGREAG